METKDLCKMYLNLCEREDKLSFLYKFSKDDEILKKIKETQFGKHEVEMELMKGIDLNE